MRTRLCLTAAVLLLAATASRPDQDAAQNAGPSGAAPAGPEGAAGDAGAMGADEAGDPPPAPDVPPFAGTFAQGMAEVAAHADDQEWDEALAVAESLLVDTRMGRVRAKLEGWSRGWSERAFGKLDVPLTWLGLETRTAADRAEVHYATGLVHMGLSAVESADTSFELARVLAGPGTTRLDATYNLGTMDLMLGEVIRAQIPELGGTPPAPPGGPPAGPGGPGSAGDEEAPDPLEIARAAYERAKQHLVERLQADWRHANTRANLELTMRRLAELDEIERQREEQEQEQQQDDPNQDQDQEGEQGDPSEDQGEQEPSDEEQEGEPQEPEDQEQEPEPSDPEDLDEGEGDEPEGELEERFLTEEEMKRLLDQLREHDEEGEAMRERIRRIRRVPVKRDW